MIRLAIVAGAVWLAYRMGQEQGRSQQSSAASDDAFGGSSSDSTQGNRVDAIRTDAPPMGASDLSPMKRDDRGSDADVLSAPSAI